MPKDVYYLQHDANASSDLKLKALRKVYGWEGIGWWWFICEQLRSEEQYRLEYSEATFEGLAIDMLCENDKVKEFIDYCIDRKLLKNDDGYFHSSRLDRDMKKFEASRQQRREAGQKSAKIRSDTYDYETDDELPLNDRSTDDELPLNGRSTSIVYNSIEENSIEENSINKGDEKIKLSSKNGLGIKEVFARIDKIRGYRPPKRQAEAASISRMLKHQYTPDQIIQTWESLKTKDFWKDKELYMMSVESQIGALLKNTSTQKSHAMDGVTLIGDTDD